MADAIISLESQRSAEAEARFLQVLKLRGSGFISGEHAYRLSPDGLTVFPRMADPVESDDYDLVYRTARPRGAAPGRDALGRL